MPPFVPYPGLLRERVTLQVNYPTKSVAGEDVDEWVDVATVRACVRSESGREYFAADKDQGETRKVFYIWKGPNVTVRNRLLWGAHVFDIDNPIPLDDGANHWLEIHASEVS